MAQDGPGDADNAAKRAPIPEAERQEKLTLLVLCRTKLSESETTLLRDVFPEILDSHHERVWNQLRKRGILGDEAADLLQDAFFLKRRASAA